MKTAVTLVGLSLGVVNVCAAQQPSFSCQQIESGSVEASICQDEQLSKLDAELAEVYQQAKAQASDEQKSYLRATQRGWLKGRNECWKSSDTYGCIEASYLERIARLQVEYRLVSATEAFVFRCDGPSNSLLTVRYFATNPQLMQAHYNGEDKILSPERTASGAKYAGENASFWEHQGEAQFSWQYGESPQTCVLQGK